MEKARRNKGQSRQGQRRRQEQRRQEEYRRQEAKRRRSGSNKRRKRKKHRRSSFLPKLVFCLFLLTAMLGAAYLLLPVMCVKKELIIEAGDPCPELSDFLNWKSRTAKVLSGLGEDLDLNTVADHKIAIEVYGREVKSTLRVEDTIAPVVVTKDKTVYMGMDVKAEDFIEEVEDVTSVTVRFEKKPECEKEGVQEVVLLIADEGGNMTKKTASLKVSADDEPPVISGVEDLKVPVGGSVSYKKGITVTDNIDEDVELQVDAADVDLSKVGVYEVRYKAVDAAGNEATALAKVHVEPVSVDNITEDLVNAEADKILDSLFGDAAGSMSEYDKAKKIYDWCHERIAYLDGTPKTDWVQGAYRGLVERKGDCYVYAMTAKCLLTRAGITNKDIEKIPTPTTMHYWNLIDIGEGWHHFDTCRRVDGSTFFYKTDAELMSYSNSHDGTHNYDRSRYPDIIP